jgi:DMSO/TMAO reductase YedYZ heme-binding membrane subunit
MGRKRRTLTKEEQQARNKLRAMEHQMRRRTKWTLLALAIGIYVVVPLLWYGAVEFGLVRPIQTPEFKNALSLASIVLLTSALLLYTDLRGFLGSREKKTEEPPAVS